MSLLALQIALLIVNVTFTVAAWLGYVKNRDERAALEFERHELYWHRVFGSLTPLDTRRPGRSSTRGPRP